MKKRFFALFLVFAMILQLLPLSSVTAYAGEAGLISGLEGHFEGTTLYLQWYEEKADEICAYSIGYAKYIDGSSIGSGIWSVEFICENDDSLRGTTFDFSDLLEAMSTDPDSVISFDIALFALDQNNDEIDSEIIYNIVWEPSGTDDNVELRVEYKGDDDSYVVDWDEPQFGGTARFNLTLKDEDGDSIPGSEFSLSDISYQIEKRDGDVWHDFSDDDMNIFDIDYPDYGDIRIICKDESPYRITITCHSEEYNRDFDFTFYMEHTHWGKADSNTATLTEGGVQTFICNSCGKEVEEESKPILSEALSDIQVVYMSNYFDETNTPDPDNVYLDVCNEYFADCESNIPYDEFMAAANKRYANLPDMTTCRSYDAASNSFNPPSGGFGDPDHVEYDACQQVSDTSYQVFGHWMIYDWFTQEFDRGDDVVLIVNINEDDSLQFVTYSKIIWDEDYTVDKKATFTTAGYESIHSNVDGVTLDHNEIPPIGTVTVDTATYTGSALKPAVKVTNTSGDLILATEYDVTYTNNKNPGLGKAAITFKGECKYYSGTKTYTFKILPKKPSISSLTNASSGITVKWAKDATVTGYKLYRSTNGGAYSCIKTIASNATVSYTDTGATTNGAKYQYKLISYKTADGTTCSSTGSAVKTIYRLSRPAIKTITPKAKSLALTWGANTKASGYQIQYSLSSTFASGNKTLTVKGASAASKTISSLTSNKKYYVRIRSYKTVSSVNYYSCWSATKYAVAK